MRARKLSDERGVALAVAVFALVVIGALVAGTFFAGRVEQQTGMNTFFSAQAAEAAEAGLNDALATQTAGALLALPIDPDPADATYLGTLDVVNGKVSAAQSVSRLTDNLFLLRSTGTRVNAGGGQLASRSIGQLVRLVVPSVEVGAGLTALGTIVVTGNATVSGNDLIPPDWSTGVSCPATANKAGIRYNGSLSVGGSAVVTGNPDTLYDATLDSTNIFGNTDFEALKAMRTLTLTSDVSGLAAAVTGDPPRCNTSLESNWGAPTDQTSPCFNYFPIIYHDGDLSISGTGVGQGILLVEGNLDAQGRIDFYGPVIVTGEVNIRGTGTSSTKFYGGVIAQNVELDDSRLNGNATINYSSCAISRALQGAATVTALTERSWVQLY